MPRVPWRESLPDKDMPEVTVASGAPDLDPFSVPVREVTNRSLDLLVEARPPAARVELVRRTIERGAALLADVGPARGRVFVLARERRLGPAVPDHALFVTGEFA